MSNILSIKNFDIALSRKNWDLKRLADEYDKRYPSEDGKTIYNTLRKWRSATGNPTLEKLVRICDLLECDVDHLLGRIDETNHTIKFINEETGLSERVIEKIKYYKQHPKNFSNYTNALNIILSTPQFESILHRIMKYIELTQNKSNLENAISSRYQQTEQENPNPSEAYNWNYNEDLDKSYKDTRQKCESTEYILDNFFRELLAEITK